MALEQWSPKLTRGLWGTVKGAVRDGVAFHQVGAAAREAGFAPDAATIAHLYSRAVGGQTATAREADYRGRVDRTVYLARRPGGENIAPLPIGFRQSRRYAQVVQVFGTNTLTGGQASQVLAVMSDYLLARGEAIDRAMATVIQGRARYAIEVEDAEYLVTWGPG